MSGILPNFFHKVAEFRTKELILFIGTFFFCGISLYAQDYQDFDELTVDIKIPSLGSYEIPIAIRGEQAYLAVKPLLETLRLKVEENANGKILSGYIINPANNYSINTINSELVIKDSIFELKEEDYLLTPTTLYLNAGLFQKVFGLETSFNFRSLSVNLETELELPVIKQIRLERMRENIKRVQGINEPDTIIPRNYPFFRAGMADWAVITTQQTNGLNDNRFNLGLGTMIAGGETNLRLNYSTNLPFTSRNQFYQWKYVNNQSRVFKQITAGKIFTRSTSSLFAPVVGVQFSNSPVMNRRSFGTYNLSDFTEARWTVELYVNNVLVDYTQADASGFYSFDVPIMYGNTAVGLRFYGPYGEERSEQRNINIPYNFIPKNEFEYTLSAGVVEDEENRRFSRLNLNYGLSNSITVGGGVEYLNDVSSGEVMPFINTSAILASNLLFSGEYTHGVKAEALLSYRTTSNFQVDLNYTNYEEDQTAINYNYLEERKITISSPLRTKFFTAFSRFSLNQIVLPTTKFTTGQFLLSGLLFGVSTNLTTYGIFNERALRPTVYTTLSQTYRLPLQFLFSPQIQYDYSTGELTNMILEFEKPLFKRGFFNLGYENNFRRNAHTFEVGFRYNFNFAQTSFTSRIGNRNSSFVQAAQGSFLYDRTSGQLSAVRRNSVGRAGVSIYPFLDLNYNGKRDKMEPGVPGLRFKGKPGKLDYNKDETVLRISDLQPYRELILEIDPSSLDNIAWKIMKPTISIETLPNQFRKLDIPVSVMGEVAGMVYFQSNEKVKGLGRIIINIINEHGVKVTSFLSEGDGYFSYLGLKPGKYSAVVDEDQLNNLGYFSTPGKLNFEIEVTEFGAIVDDLELILKVQEKVQ
ncbi:hypothetical protein [Christiangramia aquimixticola]|uniref:hypothetical protein n=1 Tax=Christiangramia aquimixticola TaxID=1697558 RepID=UPI003AA82D4D